MKLAHFQAVISPEVGTTVAGYGANDVSVMKYDDLTLQGVCIDDGAKKALLISYDLLGLSRELVVEIRTRCAELIGGTQADVMLSCTHTHGGPHTRPAANRPFDEKAARLVVERTVEAVAALRPEDFIEGDFYFYSAQADANINRRYTSPDNVCRPFFENRELDGLAPRAFRDPEVGLLAFLDKGAIPRELIVNFAAHPLASHTPGDSGHAITADYPGLIRRYLAETTGAHVTFVTGAAGDMFPIDYEIGFYSLDTIAKPVCREAVRGLVDARCNPTRFKMADARLQSKLVPVELPVRNRPDHPRQHLRFRAVEKATVELHLLAIGDICLVGVPGELTAELGQEIKWHSPFRRTFICYTSTDYAGYLVPANFLVAGGYESEGMQFRGKAALKLVEAAVDAMYELRPDAE